MRFDIDEYKAFTSVNKMYALANVWTLTLTLNPKLPR